MPTLFNKYYPVRKILFFFGEGALIFSSALGMLILFSSWRIFLVVPWEYILRAMAVTVVFQLSLYLFDLYDLRQPGGVIRAAARRQAGRLVSLAIGGEVRFGVPFRAEL